MWSGSVLRVKEMIKLVLKVVLVLESHDDDEMT